MKIGKLLLVWLLAAASANASGSVRKSNGSGSSRRTRSLLCEPARVDRRSQHHQANPVLRANFPNANVDVVDDMGATSTFAQQEATNAATPDERLIVLAALGLIVLQLQRKHKSLLQRRITPSS